MPVAATDLVLYPSASNPGDDVTAAGGGIGSTPVAGASAGEIFPALAAPASGTIDVNVSQQWQKAFWMNISSDGDLLSGRIFVRNGLIRPTAGTGSIFVVLTNVLDAGKLVRCWEVLDATSIYPESILTPTGVGTANAVMGAQAAVSWLERAQLVDPNSGAQVDAVGDVQLWWGNNINDATLLGIIPGPSSLGQQWSWATAEVQLLGISTLDDTDTIDNRLTAPTGTFARATTNSTGVVVQLASPGSDTLVHGSAQGVWAQQTLQPGMPSSSDVQYDWAIQGLSA